MNKDKIFEDVNNYTKFKLVEMLINKHKDGKLDNLNAIEQVADDILTTLAIAGLKFHNELSKTFDDEITNS